MDTITIKEFYKEVLDNSCQELEAFLDAHNNKDIGHFNVFKIADMGNLCKGKPQMPYNRRTYYKISLVNGRNQVEYADRVIGIDQYALIFSTPKVPYRYISLDNDQGGYFCVFTKDFVAKPKTGIVIDELPIFNPHSDFVFVINKEQYKTAEAIYLKMREEMASDYEFKYDLLRTYLLELVHLGQKLQPAKPTEHNGNAAARITTLFVELLERQFPIESISQDIQLKTAKEFAGTLNVHVNHLNKVLKDVTGKTTTEIIASRVAQEARLLLKQTSWNISEIAFCLGFEEVAHFSNFFKKQTGMSPVAFRD